jgi:hypothetical protein
MHITRFLFLQSEDSKAKIFWDRDLQIQVTEATWRVGGRGGRHWQVESVARCK